MIHLNLHTRIYDTIETMKEDNPNAPYGYFDDLNCVRWIIGIDLLSQGNITVYEATKENLANNRRYIAFGAQDIVKDILMRALRSNAEIFRDPLDLNPIIC